MMLQTGKGFCQCGCVNKSAAIYCISCGTIFWGNVFSMIVGFLLIGGIGVKTIQAAGGFHFFGLILASLGVGGQIFVVIELCKGFVKKNKK